MKAFANKKKRFIIIGTIILLVLVLAVLTSIIVTNRGIEDGFSYNTSYFRYYFGTPREVIHLYCAYESDKYIFDIDNVTLDFYYGTDNNYLKFDYNRYPIISAEVYCESDSNLEVQLRKVDDYLYEYNGKYTVKIRNNKKVFTYATEYEFNYCETVKIPREIFSKESGFFWLGFKVEDEQGNNMDARVIYYKVVGDKVELSTEKFKWAKTRKEIMLWNID